MYFSPLPGRLANGNYRYHSNFKPSSSKSISFFSRTFKLLTLGMLINVPFHLVLLLLLLQYGFPDDQLLHTYIDRQWSTFWAIHSDPSHNLLYILVLVSSLQQSQFLPTPTRDLAHLPSFMMENQLLSPHISLDQFSDHLKVVTSEKPYREYVHNLVHLEMLQYGKSHVVIPAPLQSLFTDLPPNPTYSDVFDKFAQAYMQFLTHLCRDCQAEALLHHSEYKLNLYQRKAELLVSVIARFAKVFEFVTQHGGRYGALPLTRRVFSCHFQIYFVFTECDLRFALKYGESGLIDETRFNLLRHKKQEKYLHWERFKNYITFIVAAIFYVASFITVC